VDPLTGLFNRSFFFSAVGREIARSARSGRGFCLLMMDLDDLKLINDRLGHFQGDRVLRRVGEVIADGVRRIDTAARYGGDEFVVLLPETDPTGAFVLAEKIRLGVNAMDLDTPDIAHPSISIGVVSYPGDGDTADELMISADNAMYVSKRSRDGCLGAGPRRPRPAGRTGRGRGGWGRRVRCSIAFVSDSLPGSDRRTGQASTRSARGFASADAAALAAIPAKPAVDRESIPALGGT
jgi:diguanylate cyclase (GGDEF)-like protein